jgi:hypothetical protein
MCRRLHVSLFLACAGNARRPWSQQYVAVQHAGDSAQLHVRARARRRWNFLLTQSGARSVDACPAVVGVLDGCNAPCHLMPLHRLPRATRWRCLRSPPSETTAAVSGSEATANHSMLLHHALHPPSPTRDSQPDPPPDDVHRPAPRLLLNLRPRLC